MKRGLGAFGEAWAVGELTRRGYEILARNVRYRVGEIDIVARQGADLVFVEVKCRSSSNSGPPEESMTPRRFRHLEAAIGEYLSIHSSGMSSIRVDVALIEVDPRGRVVRGEILQGVESPDRP